MITTDVRVLEDGEVVSLDGTHLGHNLPDAKGNRYCINIVSIAGSVSDEMEKEKELADWEEKKVHLDQNIYITYM